MENFSLSKLVSILGIVVIAANAFYANAVADANVPKSFTTGVYLLGIVAAAIGKGYERLKGLQSRPAILLGMAVAGLIAFTSVDPSMLTFLPGWLKSILVLFSGVIIATGRSLFGWDEPQPPQWKEPKILPVVLAVAMLGNLTACSYLGGSQASATRKFILLLDRAAADTRISLNTTHTLVLGNIIKPEAGLSLTDKLQKFNAANRALYNFTTSAIEYDKQGNGTLYITPKNADTINKLIDALSATAQDVLSDDVLTGSLQNRSQFKQLVAMLQTLTKEIADLTIMLKTKQMTVALPVNRESLTAWHNSLAEAY